MKKIRVGTAAEGNLGARQIEVVEAMTDGFVADGRGEEEEEVEEEEEK